jgi:hypothetical protein
VKAAVGIWARVITGALALMALQGMLWSQTAPAPVYVESFRKLSARVQETTFEVNLDTKNPSYQRQIIDSGGNSRFKLSFTPMKVGPGDDRILSWRVTLIDNKHPVYGDLLLPSRNPDFNESPAGHAERLDANPYAQVPLTAERVIKVDQFYCVLRVQNYRLLVPEKPYVESMSVEVKFSNTNPVNAAENK